MLWDSEALDEGEGVFRTVWCPQPSSMFPKLVLCGLLSDVGSQAHLRDHRSLQDFRIHKGKNEFLLLGSATIRQRHLWADNLFSGMGAEQPFPF
jgi:hypothetical protein